jgi:hypothetical protein
MVEIHAHGWIQLGEFDDHAFAFIYPANDASDAETLGKQNAGGEFGTEPERLRRFQVHPGGANVAKRGVQCYFTPRDFNWRAAPVPRILAPFGSLHAPPKMRQPGGSAR